MIISQQTSNKKTIFSIVCFGRKKNRCCRDTRRGFKPETNAKKVSIAPKNMKYAGYTAAYWNKKGYKK